MNEPTVTIELQTYNDLILAHEKYEMLLDAIFGNASYSWDKKYLEPNSMKLAVVLNALEPHSYETAMSILEKREADKKAEGYDDE